MIVEANDVTLTAAIRFKSPYDPQFLIKIETDERCLQMLLSDEAAKTLLRELDHYCGNYYREPEETTAFDEAEDKDK